MALPVSHATRGGATISANKQLLGKLIAQYSEGKAEGMNAKNERILDLINTPAPAPKSVVSLAALVARIPIFCIPDNADIKLKRVWIQILAGCALNTTEVDVNKWMTLILSLIKVLFPSVIDYSNMSTRVVLTIPETREEEFKTKIKTIGKAIRESKDEGVDVVATILPHLDELFPGQDKLSASLPEPAGRLGVYFGDVMDPLAWYGYLGAITFCITKNAVEGRTTSFEDSRFKAIRGKYGFADKRAVMLESGKLAPSEFALRQIHSAWRRLPRERSVYISYIVRSATSGAGDAEEAVYTTVRLMKWGDMTHLVLITHLLTMYPWVREIKEWRGELLAFDSAVRQMYLLCPEMVDQFGEKIKDDRGRIRRDTTEMPFIKVKVGDTGDIGKSNTMPMLTYIARRAMIDVQPSLNGYVIANEFPNEWDVFEMYRKIVDSGSITVESEENKVAT